ncbi:hypothetical protein [uncultured Litoreibacter sp.]|uniref:hypothetical protein n=1 Tax=uncultured Litoreibacter sp. TaxID=1392394 RepID=UPI0026370861|nr:hypothetical protein [uncultured Litoreibacter sp.]
MEDISKIINLKYDWNGQTSGDRTLSEALKISLNEGREVEKFNSHRHSAHQIIASAKQAISIDNIVDALGDAQTELVAKLGIVRAIHSAEKQSHFFKETHERSNEIDLRKFGSTWYSHLTKIICENRKREDISNIFENLSFVSFNYDRCLEHYLPKSIANYYGLTEELVQDYVQDLRVHRPYGIAGRLPWQNSDTAAAPFGNVRADSLAVAASEIRTFTQGMGDQDKQSAMHKDLMEAERIVFLGSAFHRQNLELLKVRANPNVEVLATVGGLSASYQRTVKNELAKNFNIRVKENGEKIILSDMYCEQFFREHWRTLTADPPSSYSSWVGAI